MRLIDADAFAEFLKDAVKRQKYEDTKIDGFLTVADVIEAVISELDGASLDGFKNAPTIEPEPRWIPCSERLPEVFEAYIVSGKQKYEFETKWSYFVDVAVYNPTGEAYIGPWQTFVDWKEGQETYITAWMELPDPYMWKRNEANED